MKAFNKTITTLKILEVIEKEDGTAEIIFDLTEENKTALKKEFGWKRWSNKKFSELIITGLNGYIKHIESENNNGH